MDDTSTFIPHRNLRSVLSQLGAGKSRHNNRSVKGRPMTTDTSKGNDKQYPDAYDRKRNRKRPAFLRQETLDRIAIDHANELRELGSSQEKR